MRENFLKRLGHSWWWKLDVLATPGQSAQQPSSQTGLVWMQTNKPGHGYHNCKSGTSCFGLLVQVQWSFTLQVCAAKNQCLERFKTRKSFFSAWWRWGFPGYCYFFFSPHQQQVHHTINKCEKLRLFGCIAPDVFKNSTGLRNANLLSTPATLFPKIWEVGCVVASEFFRRHVWCRCWYLWRHWSVSGEAWRWVKDEKKHKR